MALVLYKDLKKWLDQFNHQYYNGRLSKWKLVIGDPPNPDYVGISGYCDPKTKTIYVTEISRYNRKTAQAALLHEMAHTSAGNWHGEKFKHEMMRLKNSGAPVGESDFAERLPLTAIDVREKIDELILGDSTLAKAQEIVARLNMLSLAALLRLFPGASKGSGSVDLLKKRGGLFPYDQANARRISSTLKDEGRSYRQIATELTEAGHKTMRERSYGPGAVWHLLNRFRKVEET